MTAIMSLCSACRMKGDRLAAQQPSPDRFKLWLGYSAKVLGHDEVHEEIKRRYELAFGAPTLDQFLAHA